MPDHPTNEERTAEYFKLFDREKTLKRLIPTSRPVIFDVGANVGSALDEFKRWWPGAQVHCFEPQHECWDGLEARAATYRAGDVTINRDAVGNRHDDYAPFYAHDVSTRQSGFNKINIKSVDSIHLNHLLASGTEAVEAYARSLNHERRVRVVRLDEYIRTYALERIHLLKIDTQGHEPEVLEGAGEALAHVDVVVTELMFFDYYERTVSFTDIERFLLPAGFHLYDISHIAKNPMNGRTDWVDVVYVHDRLRGASASTRTGAH